MEIEIADYYPDRGGKAVKLTIHHEVEGESAGKFIEAVSGWLAEGAVQPQVRCSKPVTSPFSSESIRIAATRCRPRRKVMPEFKPKTVYVTYIAATPEKVWQALTSSEFTRKYFWDRDIELEPKLGGAFALKLPDGKVNVRGKVIAWDPPRKLSVTWQVEWPEEFRKLPECVVTYEIAKAGEAVRLTMTESHSWNVPEAILSGGRMGWPAILSSLKSLLETGKPLAIQMEPPREMIEAIKKL